MLSLGRNRFCDAFTLRVAPHPSSQSHRGDQRFRSGAAVASPSRGSRRLRLVRRDLRELRYFPVDEESPVAPLSAYGADKHACELHARVAGAIHGVPTVGLRFFNLYGPRQDPSSPYLGVISIFADRLLRGEPVEIFGDGEQARDFAFIKRCRLCAAPRYAGSKHQRFRVQCLYRESDKRAVSCTDPGGGVRNRTRRASSSGALQPGADLDRRSPTRFRTARLYCANHALRGSRNNAQLLETYGWVGKGVPT